MSYTQFTPFILSLLTFLYCWSIVSCDGQTRLQAQHWRCLEFFIELDVSMGAEKQQKYDPSLSYELEHCVVTGSIG